MQPITLKLRTVWIVRGTDREDEVSKILYLNCVSTVCLLDLGTISTHVDWLDKSETSHFEIVVKSEP